MRTSHRGRRQRAARGGQINLSVSVAPLPGDAQPRIPFLVQVKPRPPCPATVASHLHYEQQDLLAGEYNADLSVSIQRDRERSSSRVPSWFAAIDIRRRFHAVFADAKRNKQEPRSVAGRISVRIYASILFFVYGPNYAAD